MATSPAAKKKKKAPKKKASHQGVIPAWAKAPTMVPPALLLAIYKAAKKYNVPPDLLAGIWREESGSTYPNPAKNSSGYGGLFGTTDAYGTTQAQADLAASILSSGLKASKGNIAEALSYYNSGRLTGGYTSVPGQVSNGTVPGYGGSPSGSQSTVGKIENVGSKVLGVATNPVGTVAGLVDKGADAATSGVTGAIETVGKDIMYAGSIAGGGLVFILGFVLIAADIGLSSKAGRTAAEVAAAVPAGRAIGKAARAKAGTSKPSEKTSEPKSNIPSRSDERKEEMHKAKLATEKARATELRTRQKNRRKNKKEQEAAETKAYYKGATDASSPTMAKIRRDKKK